MFMISSKLFNLLVYKQHMKVGNQQLTVKKKIVCLNFMIDLDEIISSSSCQACISNPIFPFLPLKGDKQFIIHNTAVRQLHARKLILQSMSTVADELVVSGESVDHVQDGKNKFALLCTRCPSKILCRLNGDYVKEEKQLPKMAQKKNAPEVETDTITEWFLVDNMFTFENVGVSHVVGNMKYLTCADCEYGPIGWMDIVNQRSYVALPRVRLSTESS